MPEGVVERWLQCDRAFVKAGEPLAAIRIEGALHELPAPASGWLTIERRVNSMIEPGTVIGRIEES
jgi:pyruvate/2-oxoglutarate dehydrogenase complex dihydrolipoamide acyltransferase (E2) component